MNLNQQPERRDEIVLKKNVDNSKVMKRLFFMTYSEQQNAKITVMAPKGKIINALAQSVYLYYMPTALIISCDSEKSI
jgi:hypothetical protein